MPDDTRVQLLLDELLESTATPESVCSSCPELLPQVRERWRQMCQARDELDALFPPLAGDETGTERFEPGKTPLPAIPGYEVDAVLGVGGMGVVFRARHLRLNRVVALKMALTGAYAGPQERERFQREAEAIAVLRHPNVVQIHDVGDSDGRPYFTMEFVEGGSLAQKLAGLPQPARDAAALLEVIAIAVHAAHTNGIVHRDLKPGNILLTAEGIPKVGDFGLARRLSGEAGLTRTGAALGTPSYMAPEQTKASGDTIGPAADIYSLGAILYELLTGRPPFLAESVAETITQLLSQDPVPPSRLNAKVPRDLETICLKCLQKEPRLRYVTAVALADDLSCFQRGEAISARPDGLLKRLIRRFRRRPVFSGAVALATLSTIALVVGGMWLYAEQRATARAAQDDLQDMVRHLRAESWTEAAAARDRALMRLRSSGPAELHRIVEQGTRELDLIARLDAIQLKSADSLAGGVTFENYDKEFMEAFRAAGLGTFSDDPAIVARRIGETNVRRAVVTALDYYSIFVFTIKEEKATWAINVAREADPNQSKWFRQARDPKVHGDPKARAKLIATAPLHDPTVISLLSVERYLADSGIAIADRLAILRRYQAAHPSDFWLNLRLGDLLAKHNRDGEALGYLQAAVAIRPRSATGHFVLAGTLYKLEGREEYRERRGEYVEQFRQAARLNPTAGNFSVHYARALFDSGKKEEAVSELREAAQKLPRLGILYNELGFCYDGLGRVTEALDCHTKAAELDPQDIYIQKSLRKYLLGQRRLEEARAAWQAALKYEPPDHDSWYGYAELCLFLGYESEYLQQRQELLKRFGSTTDHFIAERTCRACLLLPANGEELIAAKALADFALTLDQSKYPLAYRYFLFCRGLTELRQEQFDRVIGTMRGGASEVLGPAPRLVLAIALYKTGKELEARQTLAAAVVSHDWRVTESASQDDWIYQVLRRETQRVVLPHLSEFLDGKYQPQDNDERLALTGECQLTNRSVALARLYADAFDADPNLANDVNARHYRKAAYAAALAGSGRGEGASGLAAPEKEKWRVRAREWLRTFLTLLNRKLEQSRGDGNRRVVRDLLTECQTDSDLAGLRDPAELEKLSADERKDCLAIWEEIRAMVKRIDKVK